MKRSNWKVALSFVCAAFAISASAEASGEKEFRDATGAVVTTMPQSTYDSFSGVRNKETSDPADGSQVARVSHPGIMFPYNGNEVVVMQVDDQGALVTPGANGFVAHVSVTDADGLVYDNGESLPASVFVESGIFKNPGPDSLAVMVVVGAESEIRTIAPGDGLVINGNDDSIIIQRQFVVLDSEGNIALTIGADDVIIANYGKYCSIIITRVNSQIHTLGNCHSFISPYQWSLHHVDTLAVRI